MRNKTATMHLKKIIPAIGKSFPTVSFIGPTQSEYAESFYMRNHDIISGFFECQFNFVAGLARHLRNTRDCFSDPFVLAANRARFWNRRFLFSKNKRCFSNFSETRTMLTGLYSGATALDSLSAQQEAIASNLAHLNTPGHKRMMLTFSETMQGSDVENQASRQTADFSQGRMEKTDRNLDFSINGKGFFVYQGEAGKVYSRSGVVNPDPKTNQLVNGDGLPILGEDGPIEITGDVSKLFIGEDGTLSIDAQQIGKLRIVEFDNPNNLESESQTYFRLGTANEVPVEDSTVTQGVRELSNAHPVTELIALIVGSRNFEAAQRAIRMISDTMQETTRAQ